MPIKPQPFELFCPICGWYKTYAPQSDAIVESITETCPRCGNPNLEVRGLSPIKKLFLALTLR